VLFNSFEFIFVFLPITLGVFFLLGRTSRTTALGWLTVASLLFYSWWRPINVLIIAPSVLVNFGFARVLLRLSAHQEQHRIAQGVLTLGILFNVVFLGYFKYVNFLYTTLNDIAGTNFVLTQVILPLGISFITFQKIAFLIDVYGRRVESFTLREFFLFVLFFPQLIAGPIVHFREMMPQFRQVSCRVDREHLAVGLTLFVFGLFKKVVLADSIAGHVTPIYDLATAGGVVSFFPSWIAAVGFTLQIYFDFSGYSDMALGLARCVGIRLPPNFDSPLKATSIIDFWLRWHMTLTRFLTAYLYNPLVLWLTRRRMGRRLPGLGGKHPSYSAFFELLAGPTMLTMFVSGLWHGAGYLFVLWGLLHGVYLVINHAWRLIDHQLGLSNQVNGQIRELIGFFLTFFSVAVAMVLFRSTTVAGAVTLLQGMIGANGITLPQDLIEHLGPLSQLLKRFVSISTVQSGPSFLLECFWGVLFLTIALFLPNTLQVTARYEPALGIQPRHGSYQALVRLFEWSPTLPWALVTAALAATTIMMWGGKSEFLYWQF
jgi:D-alanyl-lipoteichoic acid acyltransferase DltB (MBOAT superfamily)